MPTETITTRVDAALAKLLPKQKNKLLASLAEVWIDVVEDYGADEGPARGALLDMVRVAWRNPDLSTCHVSDRSGDDGWSVVAPRLHGELIASFGCSSEFDALITALELAPIT